MLYLVCVILFIGYFFFQAEDGIRDLVRSRGLGDVYKRQAITGIISLLSTVSKYTSRKIVSVSLIASCSVSCLSLIHI